MELSQLEAFVQVARQRSFSGAARAMDLTQPTISSRIQILERELGSSLFERRARGVVLTDAGRNFLSYAERALLALQDGQETLEGLRQNRSGRLFLGAARMIGTYVLPSILQAFRSRFPGAEVSIRTGRSQEILQLLLSDDVQLGLTRSLVHPEIEAVHLYDEEIVLVTPPGHPFASHPGVTLYDIGREPLILYDPSSTYYLIISRVCQEAGIVPRVLMQLDSVEATKKMVEQGLGISLLPIHSLTRELAQGSLVHVPIMGSDPIVLPTSVLMRRDRAPSGVSQAFLDVLREIYHPEALATERLK
ncbi:MAG: LysR family transcriptional regulator [Chloroflexi bacterium]|nr:LysR family transcriptional regulator [Chloroflexota bacterium]